MKDRKQAALDAIEALYLDPSLSKREVLVALQEVHSDIEIDMDTLEDQLTEEAYE